MTHCIPFENKKKIISGLEKSDMSMDDFQESLSIVNSILTCGEEPEGEEEVKEEKPRKKSDYQIFISQCMDEHRSEFEGQPFGAAGIVMKKCASEWKIKKAEKNVEGN